MSIDRHTGERFHWRRVADITVGRRTVRCGGALALNHERHQFLIKGLGYEQPTR